LRPKKGAAFATPQPKGSQCPPASVLTALGFEELEVEETSDNSQAMKCMDLPFRESGAPRAIHWPWTEEKPLPDPQCVPLAE